MSRLRPCVFVGSSSQGYKLAQAVQILLNDACEVTIWSQGVFGLNQGNLESLVGVLDDFDFAVLVLTPDDLISSNGVETPSPRDNVLFELGLFMGALGRFRTFIIYDKTSNLKLPSDLAGVTAATYIPHSNGNLVSALGASAAKIEQQVEKLGLRDKERFKQIQTAAKGFDEAATQMQKLIEIIARSRKVELEIISTQFGLLIDPEKLESMRKDLLDLDKALSAAPRKD